MRLILLLPLVLLGACAQQQRTVDKPSPVILKSVYYSGVEDDLLTAGLGLSGLRGLPPKTDVTPTAQQLRRLSYYQQFRALNDVSEAGGYGRLFGIHDQQAAIAGWEYWTQRTVADGAHHTVVLQIPDDFNGEQACLVVAPSSGSRNVFGAVGTSGAWALIKGCAVAYTDKGTGTEVALKDGRQYRIDGVIADQTDAMAAATSLPSGTALQIIQKHAYSQAHPEQHWGHFVLDAAQFGLQVISMKHQFKRDQVKVMAASVSNGGGAVLRAAEMDQYGLLDAVIAAEPQVNMRHAFNWQGLTGSRAINARPLLELSMQLALLEPCAALDKELDQAPFKFNTALIIPGLQQRCQMLADAGIIQGEQTAIQASQALQMIKKLGIEPGALQLAQINTLANMWAAINHTYTNSYLRQSPADNLCHSAMSAFDNQGQPRSMSETELRTMFALSNGIAPGNGIELAITNDDQQVTGRLSASPGYGFQVQHCFSQLLNSQQLQQSVKTVIAQPERNQLPTLLLHGQDDGTVAVGHSSRAYYHRNQQAIGANPLMRYYEIERVQHFDAFLAYPGFVERFLPMHPYFEQALDMMHHHLMAEGPLLPSQLVQSEQRGLSDGNVPPLSRQHIPPITNTPKHPLVVKKNRLEVHQP